MNAWMSPESSYLPRYCPSLWAVTHPTLDGCDAPGNRETENHGPQQQLLETDQVSSLFQLQGWSWF